MYVVLDHLLLGVATVLTHGILMKYSKNVSFSKQIVIIDICFGYLPHFITAELFIVHMAECGQIWYASSRMF